MCLVEQTAGSPPFPAVGRRRLGVPAIVPMGLALLSACGTSPRTPAQASTLPSAEVPVSQSPPAAPPTPAPTTAPSVGPTLWSSSDLDRMMSALWNRAHVQPAAEADDSEFLRRVTMDVAGRVPTLDEAQAFLADRAPGKRARLVDALLGSPDYAVHFADVYLDLFVGRQFRKPRLEKKLDPRAYFVDAFRENRPFDRIAREMLTFSGEMLPNGPGVFLASHLKGGGPEMAASVTARLFLGVQIQCAQCHDHPYDARYKQEDFYGLVAYFVRTKQREEKAAPRAALTAAGQTQSPPGPAVANSPTEPEATPPAPSMAISSPDRALDVGGPDNKIFTVIDRPHGQAKFKKGGATEETVVRPRFFGRTVAPLAGETLRQTLARAVVDSDLFPKTVVDRTWAQLFGRGIMEPWDDLGGEGDPRHPALLNELARDFRSSRFDVRHLLRLILLSRAYGLTSRMSAGAVAADPDPTAVFARAVVRRLTPEQLFESLLVATGADHQETAGGEAMEKKIERLLREYLFVFGDDEMAEVNTFNGNIPQALLLFNGEIVNLGARARPGGTLARILGASPDPRTRLGQMFLAAFSRSPTEGELSRLLPVVTRGKAGAAAYEDVFFALLTSTEMLTIH